MFAAGDWSACLWRRGGAGNDCGPVFLLRERLSNHSAGAGKRESERLKPDSNEVDRYYPALHKEPNTGIQQSCICRQCICDHLPVDLAADILSPHRNAADGQGRNQRREHHAAGDSRRTVRRVFSG